MCGMTDWFFSCLSYFCCPSAGGGRVQLYYPAGRHDRPPTSSNASRGVYGRGWSLKLTSSERLEEGNMNDISKISEDRNELFWCHVKKDDQTWPGLLPESINNVDLKREEMQGAVAKSHCHQWLRQQGRPVLQCFHCGPNGTKMEVLIPSEPVPFLLKHVFILIYSTI